MIKNVFKRFFGVGLFVLFGCLFSSCFVNAELIQNVGGDGGGGYTYLILSNNESGNFDGTWVNRGTENLVEFTNNGNGNWGFMYNDNIYNNIWRLNSNNAGYYYGLQTYYFFSNNKLYFHKAGLANGVTVEVNNFKLFEGTGGLSDYSNFGDNNSGYTYSLSDVVSQVGTVDSMIYGVYTYDRQGVFNYSRNIICFGGNNVYYCSTCTSNGYESNPSCLGDNNSIVNLGLDVNSTISDISPLVSDSPFVGGGGGNGGTLIPTSTNIDVAINYYETTKGFNENMCYVGTNNLTADFGTAGISFEDGSGSTIFELYHSQFSGFGNNIITNVGKFINVRTLNYGQWFYEGDNIKRLATDNGPDNGVSYIYTGFTFPFANKPVAIFFMASNLLDGYFITSSMGNDVAFYCYLKLNYSQIKEGNISYTGDVLPLVPPAIQNNVEDHFKYQLNFGNTGYYYSPDWLSNLSGDYEVSDNLELDGVFTNFLDSFNSKLSNIDFGFTFGIIPDWILYPLIFLILFRIMKH